MAFCLGFVHGLPEMTMPMLVEPPPLILGHVVPSLWLQRVLCSIFAFTLAFTLRGLQPVCKVHRHVVIPSCYAAFLAIMHLLWGQSMFTVCGPAAGARFCREWVCLMVCDRSSEAAGPRGKVCSNVLYSTVETRSEQLGRWCRSATQPSRNVGCPVCSITMR